MSQTPSPGFPRFQTSGITCLLLTGLFLLLLAGDLAAQRISYESLRMRDRQANVFFEHLVVPGQPSGESDDLTVVTLFRLENNFLNFRRYRDDDSREQQRRFVAEPTVRLNINTVAENGPNGEPGNRQGTQTRTWSEQVFAETFEQSNSTTTFVQNLIRTELPPGAYRIESEVRSDNRSRRGVTPRLKIPEPGDRDVAFLYFLDEQSEDLTPSRKPLMNMGRNVSFGRDHQLAIWFPEIGNGSSHRLTIEQLRIQQRDTTSVGMVLERDLESDSFHTGLQPDIVMHDDRPHLVLSELNEEAGAGYVYLTHIPNSTFENAHYRIRLYKIDDDGEETTLASRIYQSLWLDMPVSLLNVDVAVEMMRFIMDDDAHRELRRSSRSQKERRFREFWKERDPTPDKEYNELMVEYFRRIDYAFENFTTPQQPGYESDQGRLYIRRGAPDRKERLFPPNQPTREKWHYGDRTFVFEATTGFGDYRLIDRP
ncbi:GWxTD domain-containing protein [Balneolales bacterium ANBcel1]|nr:GWxTD domain-containing protein [Balneolales bacterium ANBcel1]